MAINIQYLHKQGLSAYDLFVMDLIHQNTSEDMTEELILYLNESTLKRLLTFELVKTIKRTRKADHDFKLIRLNKKGLGWRRDAKIPNFTPEDTSLYEYLEKAYTKLDKSIGSPEGVKDLLAWFRVETGYSRKQIYKAINLYLGINEEDNGGKYISSLQHLLWKPTSLYETKPKLSQSKLYQFINEHKQELNANSTG